MKLITCELDGPLIIEPQIFGDDRGFFLESWNASTFSKIGIKSDFVQDNHSRSQKGVLRGLHFQNPGAQGKLVRVTRGAVYDVAVDLRRSSCTFGKWVGRTLSAANRRMFWVPPGFAHGFLTLENDTDFLYKCDGYYSPEHEHSLAWDDPDLNIDWPTAGLDIQLSEKDRAGKAFGQVRAFS